MKKATIAASCGIISLGILGGIFPTYARNIPIAVDIIQTVDSIRGYFFTNKNGETYGTFIKKGDGKYEEDGVTEIGKYRID